VLIYSITVIINRVNLNQSLEIKYINGEINH